jgi:hypothetical protein
MLEQEANIGTNVESVGDVFFCTSIAFCAPKPVTLCIALVAAISALNWMVFMRQEFVLQRPPTTSDYLKKKFLQKLSDINIYPSAYIEQQLIMYKTTKPS